MELPVESPEVVEVPPVPSENQMAPLAEKIQVPAPEILKPEISNEPKISALSLSSIRAKRELEQTVKPVAKEQVQLPSEPFNETDMLLYWNKYAQKLGDKGQKIMESLLLINDPVLNGTAITLELPNEGSKIDFETEKNGLLGYLKGHLHNHDITIEVTVNEAVQTKKTYSNQDRYNRLHEINPAIEVLRNTFGLDINN